jgi:cyclopropane fatty-acyl-phospholipid synthase-like methyltransferase
MDVPRDWWKGFFSGLAVELWRSVMTEEQTRREADFLEKQLRVRPGASLLDVPCGGGRLALELAARGYTMTGVEFADAFVEEARAKSAQRLLKIAWHQRDMRGLDWHGAFDGVFCFGNSFGYLEDTQNLDFLRAVGQTLKPGARFALETWCTELAVRTFQERSWYKADEILMLEENEYDFQRGRLNTEYTFISGASQERKRGTQRIYSLSELCGLLDEAGFTEVKGFGSLDLEPVHLGSQRLLLTAARRFHPSAG